MEAHIYTADFAAFIRLNDLLPYIGVEINDKGWTVFRFEDPEGKYEDIEKLFRESTAIQFLILQEQLNDEAAFALRARERMLDMSVITAKVQ